MVSLEGTTVSVCTYDVYELIHICALCRQLHMYEVIKKGFTLPEKDGERERRLMCVMKVLLICISAPCVGGNIEK